LLLARLDQEVELVSIDGTASVAIASKLMREADVDERVVTQTIAGWRVPAGIV
jgi:hypothetical protein